MQYVWFIWSLIILIFWCGIYIYKNDYRKEMLKISLITMPIGLSEPLFIPEYWFPPSLFNLAEITGFDIESLIFSFSIGGLGTVLYRLIYKRNLARISSEIRNNKQHKYHIYILFVPVIIFLFLSFTTSLNPIYTGTIAMFLGAIATLYCRRDLKRKIWIGGVLFTFLYFVYFGSILVFYPDYVQLYWNLENLTNKFVFGIPIDELIFAYTFGIYWSGLYEHLYWGKLIKP